MNEVKHGLVGAYAADALEESEREDFEQHVATCPDCRAEVGSLHEATATLAEATAVNPPGALRERVMAQIGAVRPLPPEVSEAAEVRDGPADELAARRRRRRVTAAVGVAAAAIVAVVGVGVSPLGGDTPSTSPSQRVLQADDALHSSVDLGGGARATVVHSESVGQSVIRTEEMPPPPAGSVYQLWYAEDEGFVNAGLMPVDTPDQTVRLQGDSREASGVGITVEPVGGSSTPTSEPIAQFDFGPAA